MKCKRRCFTSTTTLRIDLDLHSTKQSPVLSKRPFAAWAIGSFAKLPFQITPIRRTPTSGDTRCWRNRAAQLLQRRESLDELLDRLIDRYELESFSMIGLTSMFVQNLACIALARKLKQRDASIVTLMGGANCKAPMGTVLAKHVDPVDFVFSGPALKTLPEFLRHHLDGRPERCHQMPGVYSQQKIASQLSASLSGSHPEIGPDLDIDEPLTLDYDEYMRSVQSHAALKEIPVYLPFETSRGCWWGERAHCTFCGLNGSTMKYRAMKPQSAVDQLRGLVERYPQVDHFHAVDNILPREYLTDFLPHVPKREGLRIFYEVKADLKRDQLAILASAGVTEVQPGIEALNTSTLRRMKKGTTVFQNLDFLKNCLRYGIEPSWNLLIGFPGEPEEVYRKYLDDIPRLTHLPPPGGTFPVRFDRYSPYFTQAKEYGLKLVPYDSYEMLYPFPNDDLEQLAYFFADQNYSSPYMQTTAKWIRKLQDCIADWRRQWEASARGDVPRLDLREDAGQTLIRDSRGEADREFAIDPLQADVLAALERPLDRTRLAGHVPDLSAAELDQCIASLDSRGLLFHEDGRYLSLVMDRQSAPVEAADLARG